MKILRTILIALIVAGGFSGCGLRRPSRAAAKNSSHGPVISSAEIPEYIKPELREKIERLYSSSAQTRADNAIQIGRMKKNAIVAVPFLIGMLNDNTIVRDDLFKKKKVRITVGMAAARALGWIGDVRAVEPLIEVQQQKVNMIRACALALSNIGKPALKPLIASMKDKDHLIRMYTANALGAIGNPQAVDVLIDALKDKDYGVKANAVDALNEIGDPRAVMPLITVLKEQDVRLKKGAVRALGRLNDPRAIEPLISVLRVKDISVRASTSVALEMITKENPGTDYYEWRNWWELNKKRYIKEDKKSEKDEDKEHEGDIELDKDLLEDLIKLEQKKPNPSPD